MSHRRVSPTFLAATLALVASLLCAPRLAAEEKPTAGTADGPLLIAQRPAKPKTTKHDLKYKLKRGDVLRYEVLHRASIRTTIDETTQAAQTKTDSVKAWKVTDVLPDGEIEFMNVVERVRMINQLPDRKSAEYDSEHDKTPPPGFEDAARAIGVPLSVVRITPRGKIVRREMKLRGQDLDEDAPVAVRLPEEPIGIGETWDDTFDVKVTLEKGGTKAIQTRRHHKLTKVESGIATIEVTYQVLSPIDASIECQLVQRLMSGEVRFDIEAGRMVGQRMDVDKRILGFAGPTSSMQYIMRMEEKLLDPESKVAGKSAGKPAGQAKPASRPKAARSATRTQQGGRTNRR